jgi:hypothetical protein
MSNEPRFRIALSKEALKYYTKVSVNTAEKLHKCFVVSGTMNSDCAIKTGGNRPDKTVLRRLASHLSLRLAGVDKPVHLPAGPPAG